MSIRFAGKVASVITGATAGLGRAYVRRFTQRGATVFDLGGALNEERQGGRQPIPPVDCFEIKSNGGKAEYHSLEEGNKIIKTEIDNFGRIDILDKALNWKPVPVNFDIKPKDIILYALSVGASVADPAGLRFVYEGDSSFAPLPTFGVILAQHALNQSDMLTGGMPGLDFHPSKLLHGEQFIEQFKEIPTHGTLKAVLKVVDILDKTSGALVITNIDVFDQTMDKVLSTQWSFFIVGAGGFGGKRSCKQIIPLVDPPKRKPDTSLHYKTSVDQAGLYRLNGDLNPLHIDAGFAAKGGFNQPILHGLASYGISCRLVLQQYAGNNPSLFKCMKARFASPVLPGQTLQVNMWREEIRIHFETVVSETSKVALSGGYVDLKSLIH